MQYRRIRDLREDSDLNQREVSKFLCVSQQAYSNYELGIRTIPPDMLIKLADFYKTNVDYLLGLTNNKTYYKQL